MVSDRVFAPHSWFTQTDGLRSSKANTCTTIFLRIYGALLAAKKMISKKSYERLHLGVSLTSPVALFWECCQCCNHHFVTDPPRGAVNARERLRSHVQKRSGSELWETKTERRCYFTAVVYSVLKEYTILKFENAVLSTSRLRLVVLSSLTQPDIWEERTGNSTSYETSTWAMLKRFIVS